MDLEKIELENVTNQLIEIISEYGLKLLGAIAVWVIGSFIVRSMSKGFEAVLEKSNTDTSLKLFLKSLVKISLKALLVITTLTMLGIEMTSFVAILGAAGLAVGMALSGTLQNFAGGVIILLFKPFKVGDFIDAQGYQGIVKEIQIFNTILKTLDNKIVILPNGSLSSASMTNYSVEPYRRVDFTYGIGYGDSTEKARKVLDELISADARILSGGEHDPFVAVANLGDSSVDFVVRVWVKSEDYWGVFFDMNEKVYNAFNENQINIPFPQMDVHLHKK